MCHILRVLLFFFFFLALSCSQFAVDQLWDLEWRSTQHPHGECLFCLNLDFKLRLAVIHSLYFIIRGQSTQSVNQGVVSGFCVSSGLDLVSGYCPHSFFSPQKYLFGNPCPSLRSTIIIRVCWCPWREDSAGSTNIFLDPFFLLLVLLLV